MAFFGRGLFQNPSQSPDQPEVQRITRPRNITNVLGDFFSAENIAARRPLSNFLGTIGDVLAGSRGFPMLHRQIQAENDARAQREALINQNQEEFNSRQVANQQAQQQEAARQQALGEYLRNPDENSFQTLAQQAPEVALDIRQQNQIRGERSRDFDLRERTLQVNQQRQIQAENDARAQREALINQNQQAQQQEAARQQALGEYLRNPDENSFQTLAQQAPEVALDIRQQNQIRGERSRDFDLRERTLQVNQQRQAELDNLARQEVSRDTLARRALSQYLQSEKTQEDFNRLAQEAPETARSFLNREAAANGRQIPAQIQAFDRFRQVAQLSPEEEAEAARVQLGLTPRATANRIVDIAGVKNRLNPVTGEVQPVSTLEDELQATEAIAQARSTGTETGRASVENITRLQPLAENSLNSLRSIDEVQRTLDAGIRSGTLADARNEAVRAIATLTGTEPSEIVQNTDVFTAAVGQQVADILRTGAFGSGSSITEADKAYANQIAGGEIKFSPAAISRILKINRKAAIENIKRYNQTVERFQRNNQEAGQSFETFAIPQNAVDDSPLTPAERRELEQRLSITRR